MADPAGRAVHLTAEASWATFATEQPELADRVRRRFAANLHHVLATLRADGSPRLSGTEVAIDDEVRLGMMPGSHKLADVRRDPRVELHSAPLERRPVEGDARLTGRLVEEVLDAEAQPAGVFLRLALRGVTLVQVVDRELQVTSWRPDRGLQVRRRH